MGITTKAQNITVYREPEYPGFHDVHFTYICPHCGKTGFGEEHMLKEHMTLVSYTTDCCSKGITVLLPDGYEETNGSL